MHACDKSNNPQGISNCFIFKSRLQEYVQKLGLPTPIYETIKEGLPHEPSFRSTVVVNDVKYESLPGFFNRKAAEQSAAEVALMKLSQSGDNQECISKPVHDTGLCKNLLQEYAQKMNYAVPLYSFSTVEGKVKGRHPIYTCTVDIGGVKYIGGASNSKKSAELKAARTALLAIDSDPSKSRIHLPTTGTSYNYTVVPLKKNGAGISDHETVASLKPNGKSGKKRKKRHSRKKKHLLPTNEVGPTVLKVSDDVRGEGSFLGHGFGQASLVEACPDQLERDPQIP